jgi:hypothetical protein
MTPESRLWASYRSASWLGSNIRTTLFLPVCSISYKQPPVHHLLYSSSLPWELHCFLSILFFTHAHLLSSMSLPQLKVFIGFYSANHIFKAVIWP